MLTTTPEQLARYANDIAVLWDEAQDNPALLRFLSPFGRPDFGGLTRRFRAAQSVEELIGEGYPMFATWLATMVLRDGLHPPVTLEELVIPSWKGAVMMPSLEVTTGVQLLGTQAPRTLVVAGSLKAPMVSVLDARLVIAGDLETQLLVADGCVLVGGSINADIVVCPASRLFIPEVARAPFDPARPLGCQVGRAVNCRVFDSPRFGMGCPVKADVVLHGVGVTVTPDPEARLAELLVPAALTPFDFAQDRRGGLNLQAIAALIRRGAPLFT